MAQQEFMEETSSKYGDRPEGSASDVSTQLVAADLLRHSELGHPEKDKGATGDGEAMYRHLVENAVDGIAIIQGNLLQYVNPRFAELVGCSPEEMVGAPLTDHVCPEDVLRVASYCAEYLTDTDAETVIKTALKHRQGAEVFVELNSGKIDHEDGVAVILFVREIAERTREQEEIHYQCDELSALLDTVQAFSSSLELETVMEIVTRKAKQLMVAEEGQVYLIEPDGTILKALSNLENVEGEGEIPEHVHRFMVERVAGTGVVEVINLPEQSPGEVETSCTSGSRSIMYAPLHWKDRTVGVLTVSRGVEQGYSNSDMKHFARLAGQAATAIENARLYERTRLLAATDPLTQVWNRRHIEEYLDSQANLSHQFHYPLSVLVFDIDNLKLINDAYGHGAGDEVICRVAQFVRDSCREVDVMGRYGGDEFALILTRTDQLGATVSAKRILNQIEKEPFLAPDGSRIPIRVSVGIASYPVDTGNALRLLSLADVAMYRAKMAGGGRLAFATTRTEELPEEFATTFDALRGLLSAVNAKDHYTYKHSKQVTEWSVTLGRAVGLTQEEISALEIAGQLHDLGKIGVPTRILRKPGKLNLKEWKVVCQHPGLGNAMLQQIAQNDMILLAVVHHHERYDGGGYPGRLGGDEIPLLARILTVADSFSSMVSDRPYRKALTVACAVEELQNNAGTQFDPHLVEHFIHLIEEGKVSP